MWPSALKGFHVEGGASNDEGSHGRFGAHVSYSSPEFNNLDCLMSRTFIRRPGWRNHCPVFCHLFWLVQSFLFLFLNCVTHPRRNSVFPTPRTEISDSLLLSANTGHACKDQERAAFYQSSLPHRNPNLPGPQAQAGSDVAPWSSTKRHLHTRGPGLHADLQAFSSVRKQIPEPTQPTESQGTKRSALSKLKQAGWERWPFPKEAKRRVDLTGAWTQPKSLRQSCKGNKNKLTG